MVDSASEIFGDAPNIAARVQALAEPGTVMVTARVQRQVAGLFVVEDRGAHALKGVPEPTTLYRIVRASGGGRRSGQRALTPLVGRDEEVTMLLRRWERARQGEGQFVAIVGEPGLGKSRLIEEFHTRLADTPHTWVEWSSSQLLQNTPLHPIAEWGRSASAAPKSPRSGALPTSKDARPGQTRPRGICPLLAPLLDVPLPPERAPALAREELRRRQMAAILAWVTAGARTQPVVLAFEDFTGPIRPRSTYCAVSPSAARWRRFWSSRRRGRNFAALGRALASRHDHARAARSRPGPANGRCELAQRHALSREVIDGVSERTGGVPLFIEEVTRLLLERGEQGGAQAIPPTLQQSLAARLDRLGPAREVAMIGAVLGRGFSIRCYARSRAWRMRRCNEALEKLAEADILLVEGLPPHAELSLQARADPGRGLRKPARKAAARRCTAASPRRCATNSRIARTAEPEALAHHFTQAGLTDAAIEYWGKAGDQALRRSAFQEAIAHLGKAIEIADKENGGKAAGVAGQRQQLHVAYGNALFAARGPGARETTEAFARAREAAAGDKYALERLAVDYGLWAGSYLRGELSSMRAYAKDFLSDVDAKTPDSPEAGIAHRTVGITHHFAGEYAEAREHLDRAIALFQPGRDDDLAFRFGIDPGVGAMAYLAIVLWPVGEIDRAVWLVQGMQTRLAGVSHIGARAFIRLYAAIFELMRGDQLRAAPNAIELARLARDRDLNMWSAFGAFLEGWATAESGALGGLEFMRRGVDLLREQRVLMFDGPLKIALAEAEARAGDVNRALAILDETLATSDRIGFRAFEAELRRARGEILLKRDPATPRAPRGRSDRDRHHAPAGNAQLRIARRAVARQALPIDRPPGRGARRARAALEGFAPTLEMPEIAEAQALLGSLAEAEEVKADVASRQRRLHLQISYGKAVMWSRGYAAEETKAAFRALMN